jgi:hypothetical protein
VSSHACMVIAGKEKAGESVWYRFGGDRFWLAALDSRIFAQNSWRELLDVPLKMARLSWFQILSAALHPSLQDRTSTGSKLASSAFVAANILMSLFGFVYSVM